MGCGWLQPDIITAYFTFQLTLRLLTCPTHPACIDTSTFTRYILTASSPIYPTSCSTHFPSPSLSQHNTPGPSSQAHSNSSHYAPHLCPHAASQASPAHTLRNWHTACLAPPGSAPPTPSTLLCGLQQSVRECLVRDTVPSMLDPGSLWSFDR